MSRYKIESKIRDGIQEYHVYERKYFLGIIPLSFKEVLYTQNVKELEPFILKYVQDIRKR